MKFCKDCKHYFGGRDGVYGNRFDLCQNRKLCKVSLINGGLLSKSCHDARESDGACGEDAKYFEQKEEVPEIKLVSDEPKRWWRFWE